MNLNTTMHRITLLTERDIDSQEASRLQLPTFVLHEHPPKQMTRMERIGHCVMVATCIACLFAVGVMAHCGWLPG